MGYARYTFREYRSVPDDFYDFRGRFVLGPSVRHDFGGDYFFRGTAQFVAWIREQDRNYQINVDDVYAQVGQKNVWDFQVGRFMTWRVYRKGLGFDLFTLEDQGALLSGKQDQGEYAVHTYEVSSIFFRDQQGRAAFHFYPTSWSGIEVAGQYGKDTISNTFGGRFAGNLNFDMVSVSAAAEYLHSRPSDEKSDAISTDDPDTRTYCDTCGVTKKYGVGGGAVFKMKPVELGANFARRYVTNWNVKAPGELDRSSSEHTTSVGGYLELDVGLLAINRGLIIGGGLSRTEQLTKTEAFQRHIQGAAYVAYPLGFNNAMVKVVGSYANGLSDDANHEILQGHMLSVRVRLSFNF